MWIFIWELFKRLLITHFANLNPHLRFLNPTSQTRHTLNLHYLGEFQKLPSVLLTRLTYNIEFQILHRNLFENT